MKKSHAVTKVTLLTTAIIASAAIIMLINTFTHPPLMSYDYTRHLHATRLNESWTQLLPQKPATVLEYNPPYYYYFFGKINHLIELLSNQRHDPYYLFRLGHLAMIISIAVLYSYSLLPRLIKHRLIIVWFTLALFTIPNLFLAQVMVRADHLLFLFIHLLFYCWFRFNFSQKLPRSPWRIAAWAGCLIGMSNARNFALPAVMLFGAWGILLLARAGFRQKTLRYNVLTIGTILITIALSGSYYFNRYQNTGFIFNQEQRTSYHHYYFQRQQGFERRHLFLNLEFHELLKIPNRHAHFTGGNAFLPRLYGDMWADHWLYFSGDKVFHDKKIPWKQVVLLMAVPFTLAYWVVPALYVREIFRKKKIHWPHTAALLFYAATALFIFFIYREPEVGKNSTIKFCYLFGYSWFPIVCMAAHLDTLPRRLTTPWLIYTAILFLCCLPLALFAF
jgi:hypothetical protein